MKFSPPFPSTLSLPGSGRRSTRGEEEQASRSARHEHAGDLHEAWRGAELRQSVQWLVRRRPGRSGYRSMGPKLKFEVEVDFSVQSEARVWVSD